MTEDLHDGKLSRQQGGEPGILHVMFHGTFVFNFHNDGIDVLVPKVDGHVYKAGSWLGETELICGEHHGEPSPAQGGEKRQKSEQNGHGHADDAAETFRLRGVESGSALTLPLEHNLMFNNATLKENIDSQLHARIHVPVPDRITTPRRGRLIKGQENFEHEEDLPEDYRGYLGTLQIFTYRFQSDNALRLACHPKHSIWEPAFAGNAITLHIIAAPEQFHLMPPADADSSSHVQNAFKACMDLFEGVELEMEKLPDANEFEAADVPSGAVVEETEDLAPRLRRLSQLGRMKKDERDLNLLWFPSDAYDGDPDACGNCGNRSTP